MIDNAVYYKINQKECYDWKWPLGGGGWGTVSSVIVNEILLEEVIWSQDLNGPKIQTLKASGKNIPKGLASSKT